MSCDFPLKGYRTPVDPASGKSLITFNPLKALNSTNPLTIPCGRCGGCKLERSRQWAVRCMHEAELYEDNCFITLTFSNDFLPWNYSIDVRDWQLFMKRLRKFYEPKKIRFYACGEYGDTNLRPHYHALLFNHDFNDKVFYGYNKRGDKLFTSPSLSKIWPYGLATLGAVTFESAAYVARYVMKKQTGENAGPIYLRQHPLSGLWHNVTPEFCLMSRRPGIAAGWIEKFQSDVYPSDNIISRGMKMKPPRFYDNKQPEEALNKLKRRRKLDGLVFKPHQTKERLAARRAVREARTRSLTRTLKDDDQ